MRKVILIIVAVVFMVGVVGVSFAGGVVVGQLMDTIPVNTFAPHPATPSSLENAAEPETTDNRSPELDYRLMEDVLRLLSEQYYGDIPDNETLSYGAVRGIIATLDDPYTSFIEPKAAAILNEDASGKFEGIGATVRMREDGYLEVVRPLPGHPAEAAGVKAGDLILSVNEQSIVGMGLYEAIGYVRGPAGTEALLEIARQGEDEPLYITVVRARIEMPIVESKMLEGGYAYIRLSEFDATADTRLKSALQDLLRQNPKGLIFDLRDDPGGYLDQAIKVSDLFLDEGLVAIKRDSDGNEQRFNADSGDIGESIPMVVLINPGSASASEIVAGALQDRDRAILIGETSLGKGSVQLANNLDDGSQLRITIARWYTPDDKNIHNDGLKPDIEVTIPDDNPVGEDPQLDRAVEYLKTGE